MVSEANHPNTNARRVVLWSGWVSEANPTANTGLVWGVRLVQHPGRCITEEAEGPLGPLGLEVMHWTGCAQVGITGLWALEGPEGARKGPKGLLLQAWLGISVRRGKSPSPEG